MILKKNTLFWMVLFAVLLGYVWFGERKIPVQKPGEIQPVKIFSTNASDIQSFQITRNHRIIRLERSGPADWVLKSPVEDWADPDECRGFADFISGLTAETAVAKEENAAAYGLGSGTARLETSLKSGGPLNLRIGSDDPARTGTYIFDPSRGKIFLVPLFLGQAARRPVEQWRDHAVVRFHMESLAKIEIKTPHEAFSLQKSQNNWTFGNSPKAKADPEKVMRLLEAVSMMRISSFVQPNTRVSLVPRELLVQLWETGNRPPETVTFGPPAPAGVPAQTSGRTARYFVPIGALRQINTLPQWYKPVSPKASK